MVTVLLYAQVPMSLETSDITSHLEPVAPSQALENLRLESQLHNQQTAQQGLISTALTEVTQFWNGTNNSDKELKRLESGIAGQLKAGNQAQADQLAQESGSAIEADSRALSTAGQIDQYGTALINSVGLFMPGKIGFAITGAAAALESYKPKEKASFSEKAIDVGLGISKAVGLKAAFVYAADNSWSLAGSAVGLGAASRIADVALNRATYLDDSTGQYSLSLGAVRTLDSATNTTALASDVASFLVARGAMGKLGLTTLGAGGENKLFSTIATAGIFGGSKAGTDEIVRQSKEGVFEPGQLGTRVLASAATNMLGAVIGGRAAAIESIKAPEAANVGATRFSAGEFTTKDIRSAGNNFPGSTSREYLMVGDKLPVSDLMSKSDQAFTLTRVRAVVGGVPAGPEQSLLIQHSGVSAPEAAKLAANADLIASCDPSELPLFLRSKHIIPSAQSLWLTQDGAGMLRFSNLFPSVLRAGESQPVALGPKTVSELLRSSQTPSYLEDTHDIAAIARAMEQFRTPVTYFTGGADSILFEMPDKNILKITDKPWDKSWGSRTIDTPSGKVQIDAPILAKPQTIRTTGSDFEDAAITYFVQQRLSTPVSTAALRSFDHLIEQDGTYKFWDNDFQMHGRNQLGEDPKTRRLYLLDYDAVRLPHLLPEKSDGHGPSITSILRRYDP